MRQMRCILKNSDFYSKHPYNCQEFARDILSAGHSAVTDAIERKYPAASDTSRPQ